MHRSIATLQSLHGLLFAKPNPQDQLTNDLMIDDFNWVIEIPASSKVVILFPPQCHHQTLWS